MIYDSIQRISLYQGLSAAMDDVIDFLIRTDCSALPNGRYDVGSHGSYINVVTSVTVAPEAAKWERHTQYADIQYDLFTGEVIGYLPTDAVPGWDAYDPVNDRAFSAAPGTGIALAMHAGSFAVFFPNDAHKACIAADTPRAVGKKIVAKVPI
jgi:biofilm protein TabA